MFHVSVTDPGFTQTLHFHLFENTCSVEEYLVYLSSTPIPDLLTTETGHFYLPHIWVTSCGFAESSREGRKHHPWSR